MNVEIAGAEDAVPEGVQSPILVDPWKDTMIPPAP